MRETPKKKKKECGARKRISSKVTSAQVRGRTGVSMKEQGRPIKKTAWGELTKHTRRIGR